MYNIIKLIIKFDVWLNIIIVIFIKLNILYF